MIVKKALLLLLFLAMPVYAVLPAPGEPGAVNDPRYCGEPERYSDGRIKRSAAVLRDFAEVFPCPGTLVSSPVGCTDWQINHTIPLASGGCDSVLNLSWMPLQIKTCSESWCVDRWERTYHSIPRRIVILD